jgi:hypothetical protein
MATIAEILAANAVQVDALLTERDRLVSERRQMLAARVAGCVLGGVLVCALDPGEFQSRADAALALIASIEDHVGVRLPPLEQKARAGDMDAAKKAFASTRDILRAVRGVSPVDNTIKDAKRTVDDIKRDASFAVGGLAFFGVATLIAVVLLK